MRILSLLAIFVLLVTVYATFDDDVRNLRNTNFVRTVRTLWETDDPTTSLAVPGVCPCHFLVHLLI